MSDRSSNEIEIPQAINKPKGDEKLKAGHPIGSKNKMEVQPKPITITQVKSKSRFEPEAIPVEIPSHGFLYKGKTNDGDLVRGIVKIRQMTLNEEKILTTDRLVQQGKALDMILENCIKSDFSPYDLLSSDRLYLLFYLRGMSYGLDYDFDVRCYHCGANFLQTIQIDKLPVKEWETPEDAIEPIVIKLPQSGAIVESHYMRGSDESKLMEKAREIRNFNQADDDIGDSLVLLIDKVTMADGEMLNPRDREDFINFGLIGGDADFFRDVLREKDCGIKQLDHIYCPKCNGDLAFNVPLGRNFFRRSRRG
jgi:hypothetical protein